jgi:hypothetical protein
MESNMRKIAILALIFLALAQLAAAAEQTGSFADVKTKSAELNKPILLEFYAEW